MDDVLDEKAFTLGSLTIYVIENCLVSRVAKARIFPSFLVILITRAQSFWTEEASDVTLSPGGTAHLTHNRRHLQMVHAHRPNLSWS